LFHACRKGICSGLISPSYFIYFGQEVETEISRSQLNSFVILGFSSFLPSCHYVNILLFVYFFMFICLVDVRVGLAGQRGITCMSRLTSERRKIGGANAPRGSIKAM